MMNRHVTTLAVAGLVLTGAATGCAHRSSSFMPSASVRFESVVPVGAWHGTVDTPDSRKGEPFVATVPPRGNAFYGTTDVLYRGGRVASSMELGRRA